MIGENKSVSVKYEMVLLETFISGQNILGVQWDSLLGTHSNDRNNEK